MTVELTAQIDGALRYPRETQPLRSVSAPIHTLATDLVVVCLATKIPSGDLLDLLHSIFNRGPVRSRVRMGRRAATLRTAPG